MVIKALVEQMAKFVILYVCDLGQRDATEINYLWLILFGRSSLSL